MNKREATYEYQDVYQTRLHEGSSVHQHHQLRKRFREITKLDWGELAIILPKFVKVEPQALLLQYVADELGIHWDIDSTCRCNVVYRCNTHVCVSYCRYPRYVQTNSRPHRIQSSSSHRRRPIRRMRTR